MNQDFTLELLLATALNTRAHEMLAVAVPPGLSNEGRVAWKREHFEEYVNSALTESLVTVAILRKTAGTAAPQHPPEN